MIALLLVWLSLAGYGSVARAGLSVQCAVEKQSVTVGEPFVFQIQIKESDNPEQPAIPEFKGFTVEFLGEQTNGKQYVSIVNGRVKKVVSKGYIFNYRLTPVKVGKWTIPSITVRADGVSAATNPVVISVTPPRIYDNLKLHLSFSKSTCYIGEPVVLTLTWYLSDKVQNARLSLPFLQDTKTFFVDDLMTGTVSGARYYSIPWEGGEVSLRAGRGRLDGQTFTTLTLNKIIIPRCPGDHVIRDVKALCQILKGYKQRRRGGDGFFDDFFTFGRQAVYESAVVPAPPVTLRVQNLPGRRPPDFSGIVGRVDVTATVVPQQVKVGEPMTLKIRFSGMEYVKQVPAPDLTSRDSFTRMFKIPVAKAPGIVDGQAMVFSQTIRPKSDQVTAVPPVEICYFDVDERAYKTARSKPIPIDVEAVKVVTMTDAEGSAPVMGPGIVKSKAGGVAHNYTGLDVLIDQSFSVRKMSANPAWWCFLLLPMLFYSGSYFAQRYTRRLSEDPSFLRRRQALKLFKKRAVETARLLDEPADFYSGLDRALRSFIADLLALPAGRHEASTLVEQLRNRGVSAQVLARLAPVMDDLDAACFGGLSGSRETRSDMLDIVRDVAETIRREVQT